MLLWNMRNSGDEAGRASLEFLFLAIVLLIPILFLGLSNNSLQSATLAAESAARNAVRVFVIAPNLSVASRNAEVAARGAAANHGFDALASLEKTCQPSDCLTPGAIVTITVGLDAPLFSSDLIPGLAGASVIRVEAQAHNVVSTYGGL